MRPIRGVQRRHMSIIVLLMNDYDILVIMLDRYCPYDLSHKSIIFIETLLVEFVLDFVRDLC